MCTGYHRGESTSWFCLEKPGLCTRRQGLRERIKLLRPSRTIGNFCPCSICFFEKLPIAVECFFFYFFFAFSLPVTKIPSFRRIVVPFHCHWSFYVAFTGEQLVARKKRLYWSMFVGYRLERVATAGNKTYVDVASAKMQLPSEYVGCYSVGKTLLQDNVRWIFFETYGNSGQQRGSSVRTQLKVERGESLVERTQWKRRELGRELVTYPIRMSDSKRSWLRRIRINNSRLIGTHLVYFLVITSVISDCSLSDFEKTFARSLSVRLMGGRLIGRRGRGSTGITSIIDSRRVYIERETGGMRPIPADSVNPTNRIRATPCPTQLSRPYPLAAVSL